MFTIIGGDGQEYGPASVEQLRTWLTSGRANLETRARKAGEEGFKRLGDFAEFAPPAGAPPLMGGGAVVDTQLAGLAISKWVTENMQPGNQPDIPAMLVAIQTAAPLAYPYLAALAVLQGVLIATRSQSVGKILLGLRIVNASDGGKTPFVRAFLVRSGIPSVIEYIPILGGLFWLVDTCFIFRADRRCVHDLMAGTKVVKL